MTSRIPPGELQPYWGDPAAFEATLRARRDEASGALRDEFTTQVARALGLQGRFDEASAELDAVSTNDPVVLQRLALERGRILNSSGDPEAAVAPFTTALEVSADEFLTVDALHMLAIADPDNSEDWTRRGLRIAMTSHDADVERWQGSLLNNHAWNLADVGRESEALAVFRRADEWFAERGTPVQRSRARWAVAHLLRRTGDNAGAREILESLLTQDPDDTAAADELALLPHS